MVASATTGPPAEHDAFEESRHHSPPLNAWLKDVLEAARAAGQTVVLLTSDDPYEYGKKKLKDLFKDLRWAVERELIDVWFWGNTHYCALFRRNDEKLPFVGSCIGHGGYPYGRLRKKSPSKEGIAKPAWLETGPRHRLRIDRGNDGHCITYLKADGGVRLEYIDWLCEPRAEAELWRDAAGKLRVQDLTSRPLPPHRQRA